MEEINLEFVNELISLNIFNIVTKTEVKELKKELKIVFLEGMSEFYTKEKFGMGLTINKSRYDFKKNQMLISVTGALQLPSCRVTNKTEDIKKFIQEKKSPEYFL